jgi:hypothetical protein
MLLKVVASSVAGHEPEGNVEDKCSVYYIILPTQMKI